MNAVVEAPARTSRRSRVALWAYLLAEVVSTTGTRMSMVAIPWFVLTTTGSAATTGVVAFAETLPYVIVLALGGPVVDRFGAWRVAILAGVTAAALVGAVPALYAAGSLHLGVLVVLVAAVGAVRGLETSTYVLLPGLADEAGMPLTRATGLHDGMNRTAGMLGVPLAGVLIAVSSAPAVLLVDAASFLIAALLLGLLVPRTSQPPTREAEDAPAAEGGRVRAYVDELREGFGFLLRDRMLVAIAVLVLVTNLLDQAYSAVMVPVWVHDELGSPLALGLIGGVFGVGAVVGSSVFAWLGPRLPRRRSFAWGFLVGGAPRFVVLALAVVLPPVLAVSLVAGLAVGAINPALAATEYERIPRHLQARVIGALAAVAMAGIPVGGLLGGLAVQTLGLSVALLVFGGVYLATTLCPFIFPVWREMDRAAEQPVDVDS
ncbi:MAG TPA: MFS transporter [Candidatus Nanopelagicales bacterium]|nr:MFS transporter [Candidatus Nanopelagicales bacterium]